MPTSSGCRFLRMVFLLCLACWLGREGLVAQNFPVRASTTVITSSPYLEDYGRDGNLIVILTLVDRRDSYDGLLRITIEGDGYRATTSGTLFQTPITLRRGQPLILRGSRLAPYFDLNNLDVEGFGVDGTVNNGGSLPDGPITICAEFYDLNRFNDPPVSNPACATRFVQQNYPPELVHPLTEIPAPPTELINFTWNPRHVPQPLNDEYELTVWEKVEGLTYDQIINSTGPLRSPIITTIPRYTYTNYDSPLEVGQEYIWRVKVRDRRNVREFINFGISDFGEFRYGLDDGTGGDECPTPQRLFVQGVTSSGGEIGWEMGEQGNISGFAVRYRLAGNRSWVTAGNAGPQDIRYLLNNLEPETNYEAELCALCTDGNQQCAIVPFLTLSTSEDCGPLPTPVTVPLTENALRISWPSVVEAMSYRINWAPVVTAPPTSSPAETPRQRQRENPGGGMVPPAGRQVPPRTSAPAPTSPLPDSLLLPAGSTEGDVFGLLPGTDYTFTFCKICPDGTEECFSWTVDFNGIDDDCLTNLNFTRPDSTETTLDLAWTYNPASVAANDSFTLIWQVSDRTLPEIMASVAYADATYTITDRIPGQTYTLQVCAECTAGQPVCEELAPFGGCPADYTPQLVDLASRRALVGFDTTGEESVAFEWRYAMRSFGNWSPLVGGSFSQFNPTSYDLPGDQMAETPNLQRQLVYAAQIRNTCYDTLWSAWSEPVEFSTGCKVVDTLSAINITDSSAVVTAVPIATAAYYQYYYRLQGATEWTLVDEVPNPSLPLTGLLADTTYEAKMRFWCTLGVWSDETEILSFQTLPPCGKPQNAFAYALEATAAGLTWQPGENALSTTIRYKRAGGGFFNQWMVEQNLADSIWLADLRGGARYRYRLLSDCGVNQSGWTERDTFTLLCAPPEQVLVNNLTYESAGVYFGGLSPTSGEHEVSYRLLGEASWQLVTVSNSPAQLEALDDLATYEVRVRTLCQAGQYSVWSDTVQFDTPVKCLVPENLGVRALTSNSADIRWDVTGTVSTWEIRFYDPTIAVAVEQTAAPAMEREGGVSPGGGTSPGNGQTSGRTSGTIPGRSGPPAGGTTPNTGGGTIPNTSGPVRGQPGNIGVSTPATPPNPYANWQVMTTTDPEKFFSGLGANTAYKVVVRAECPTFGWTDYSEVLEFRTLCPSPAPDELAAENILETEARLEWSRIVACLEEYSVTIESLQPVMGGNTVGNTGQGQSQSESRGGGIGPGRTSPPGGGNTIGQGSPTMFRDSVTTTDEFYLFTGLQANTEYRFRVRGRVRQSLYDPPPPGYLTMADWALLGANAGADEITGEAGWTPYSAWFTFRTDHCAQPFDLMENTIDRSTMEISWAPSNGINDYEFKYKLADDAGSSWAFLTVTEPVVVLENLLSNAVYDYQVTEICQDGITTRPAPQDTFIMKKPSINNGYYVCGMLVGVDLSNEVPLPELFVDDTIRAFDFPVVITETSGSGGTFSGKGEIRVPYFNKAKMTFIFNGIFINDDYQMVGGYMEATGFGIEVLPPWADSLLGGIITGLEMLDGALADQQVTILDSLMTCCADYLPPALQDTIQAIIDCYENNPDDPIAAGCQDRLDSLMVYIGQNLDSIVTALDTQIVASLTDDIIRLAMQELSTEHAPLLPDKLTAYQTASQLLESSYPVLPTPAGIPDYLPNSEVIDPGSGGSSTLNQFGENAGNVQTTSLSLTLEDMHVNTEPKVPTLLELKTFTLALRTGDTDVYTPIHDEVEALWNDPEGGPDFDQRPLIDQAKILLTTKYTFLVNE